MAEAEPTSVSTFMKRAKSSEIKLPFMAALSTGMVDTQKATPSSSRIDITVTKFSERSFITAPNISSTMAPTASAISGRTGASAANWNVSVMAISYFLSAADFLATAVFTLSISALTDADDISRTGFG